MSTISSSSSSETVEIKIPAAYLEDVRSALIAEIVSVSDALRVNQDSLISGQSNGDREDRAYAAGWLRNDVRLLDQLLDASGDTKVTAERNTVTEALQALVRVLVDRLGHQCEYAPIGMGSVLELSAAVRWAAEEAIRIEPASGGDYGRVVS